MSHKIHMLSSSPTQATGRIVDPGPERPPAERRQMACYTLVRKDGEVELIEGADTYEQEGPLTTFFQVAPDRRVIDCWSVRLMSIRTTEIESIRRVTNPASGDRIEPAQRCGLEVAAAVG